MKEIQFSIEIHASKKRVWDTLWRDETFRQWAGILDEGTYMRGELKEGGKVEYLSSVNGLGVTSLVEKLIPGEYVLLRHSADTKGSGKEERENEWTGGKESYSLTETDGTITLSVAFDVPEKMEGYFKINYPKAFEKVKELAEISI